MKTEQKSHHEPHRIWKIFSCLLAVLSFQALGQSSPKIIQAHAERICNLLTDIATPVEKAVPCQPASLETQAPATCAVQTDQSTSTAWRLAALCWQFAGTPVCLDHTELIIQFSHQPIGNNQIKLISSETLSGGQLRLLALLRQFSQIPPPQASTI
ncbi:MAG TPA: hypothetical protein VMG59_00415 [Phycisphaerae bacterium]|nr:hypothetical protein [Phycisphaerae bacterium]